MYLYNKNNNRLISNIKIGKEDFVIGDCFIQRTTTITIEYYILKIQIGNKESSYVGKQWQEVKNDLETKGFTNIKISKTNSLNGWDDFWGSHEESVKSVTIKDINNYVEADEFYYYDPISILVNTYSDKDYNELDKAIRGS